MKRLFNRWWVWTLLVVGGCVSVSDATRLGREGYHLAQKGDFEAAFERCEQGADARAEDDLEGAEAVASCYCEARIAANADGPEPRAVSTCRIYVEIAGKYLDSAGVPDDPQLWQEITATHLGKAWYALAKATARAGDNVHAVEAFRSARRWGYEPKKARERARRALDELADGWSHEDRQWYETRIDSCERAANTRADKDISSANLATHADTEALIMDERYDEVVDLLEEQLARDPVHFHIVGYYDLAFAEAGRGQYVRALGNFSCALLSSSLVLWTPDYRALVRAWRQGRTSDVDLRAYPDEAEDELWRPTSP